MEMFAMTRLRRIASRMASAVLALFVLGPVARAGQYDFSITTAVTAPAGGSVTAPSEDSWINFFGPVFSPSPGNATAPGTDMIFGQFQLGDLSDATTYTDNYSIAYTFAVTLKDSTSTLSHVFDISGTLTGFIKDGNGIFSSQFTNTYTSPLSQTATIGGLPYTISVSNGPGYFTTASPPNAADGFSSTYGAFMMLVSPQPVPEPSSVVLLGIGLSAVAGLLRRRRACPAG
jgi:hypothetical protein